MSINAPSSSTSVSSSSQVNSASNSSSAQKTSSDSSFKEEMDKVSSSEKTKEEKSTDKVSENTDKVTDKSEDKNETTMKESNKDSQNQDFNENNDQNQMLEGSVDYSKYASLSMADVNSMLSNDIAQMANNSVNQISAASAADKNSIFGSAYTNSISMTESDANFFIGLTQQNEISTQNISMQNVTAQAQNMLNAGAEAKEVKQNVQISQTLLNAINTAKENNQPLRIDFDQNVSVIMRISKDGVISANFIPGDKAVEQYLKSNIDNLKATFNEQDLPYSDLSYSNRGRQQQKERRNKQ